MEKTRSKKSYFFWSMAFILNAFLLALSTHLIWGWLTLADIKSQCIEKGYDVEAVLYSLIGVNPDFKVVPGEKEVKVTLTFPKEDPFFKRLRLQFHSIGVKAGRGKDNNIKDLEVRYKNYYFLDNFLMNSNTVVDTWFSLGAAYLMSTLILILKFLRKERVSLSYFILRPIAGAIASASLYIVLVAGGSLIWNKVGQINTLSIGLIAIIGSIYCEKFERILDRTSL